MADVLGLGGFNPLTGVPIMFVGYGNDIVNLSSGLGYGQNITPNTKCEFVSFLNAEFEVNGVDTNRRYSGSSWVDETARKHAPIAYYPLVANSRVYLANLTLGSTGLTFPSRVWFSDLPMNGDITYGLEYGTDLKQTASSPTVQSASAFFKLRNIKPGDPFTITNGVNAGEYIVFTIDSETQITLTVPLTSSATGSIYYVGGNFFDVNTNNSDVVTGIGENDDRVLAFKRRSLYRFDRVSLRKVKGVPGTTSHRSIANVADFTFYFHDTGVWRYNGGTSELISRGIQDYIDGVDPAFYSNVVGWRVGNDIYRIYLGNVDNTEKGLSVPNCILDYDTATQSWSPGRIADVITAKSAWTVSDVEDLFLGTNDDQVLKDNSGFTDNNTPIEWAVDTGYFFPVDPDTITEMCSTQIHMDAGRGTSVMYKLYGTPNKTDKEWLPLGDIKEQITELKFDRNHERFARGIAFKLLNTNATPAPGPVLTRISLFHKPRTRRLITENGIQ